MKSTLLLNLVAIGLVLSVGGVGCRKKPTGVTNIPNQRLAHVPEVGTLPPIESEMPDGFDGGQNTGEILTPIIDPSTRSNWEQDSDVFKVHTVHFAFDSSAVRSSDKAHVAAVAEYLKANAIAAVRVEGHCDERGTEEYNRALGERRALAIRDELIRLGVDASRVETISFGEDRPVNPDQTEEAFRQNRRGEFILLSPPQ
jgi:Outer membrane protein and related peptidoglycan-associated (lipo)proteins